jgi:integrase
MTDKWSIEDFLSQYNSESTLNVYRSALREYFKLLFPKLQEHKIETLDEKLVDTSLDYINQDRDFRKDLMRYRKHISTNAPKTIITKLAVLIRYFESNQITFNKNFRRNLQGRATEAISKEHVPDKTEINRILEYMPIQARTLSIVLVSSGMRIGEALSIKLDDLELDQEPTRINLRASYTETKKSRLVFISTEAKKLLLEWLDYRPRFIEKNSEYLDDGIKAMYSEMVFPFTGSNFRKHWGNVLKKAGLFEKDPETNRMTIRPHNLRKFFRT